MKLRLFFIFVYFILIVGTSTATVFSNSNGWANTYYDANVSKNMGSGFNQIGNFSDNFDDGTEDWNETALSYTASVVNGEYRVTSDSTALAYSIPRNTSNVTNSTILYKMRFNVSAASSFGTVARYYNAAYYWIINREWNGDAYIYIVYDSATNAQVADCAGFTSNNATTYNYKTVVNGSFFAYYQNNVQVCTGTNTSYTSGKVGVGWAKTGSATMVVYWDDFVSFNNYDNGTPVTIGNITHVGDAGAGNTFQTIITNITTPGTSYYDVFAYANGSSTLLNGWYSQTGNNSFVLDTPTQNLDIVVRLSGNETYIPEEIRTEFVLLKGDLIPENLASTQGNFWINHTWTAASTGNITDSYNVSVNGVWANGTTSTYLNTTLYPHGWQNITVYGFNNSLNKISSVGVSSNVQIANNIPVLATIGSKVPTVGIWENFTMSATDLDNDPLTFATNSQNGTLDANTGNFSWNATAGDVGVHTWNFNVSDNNSGVDSEDVQFLVYLVQQTFDFDSNLYWVRNGGNNSCSGQNNMTYASNETDCAWATLAYSGNNIQAGKTLNVVGNFTNETMNIYNFGTVGSPVKIVGVGATLEGNSSIFGIKIDRYVAQGMHDIEVSYLNLSNYSTGIRLECQSGLVCKNVSIHNNKVWYANASIVSDEIGTNDWQVQNISIKNNEVKYCHGDGIRGTFVDSIIANNNILDCWDASSGPGTEGIGYQLNNVTVENNTLKNITQNYAISMFQRGYTNIIRNNTITNSSGRSLRADRSNRNFIISNNVVTDAAGDFGLDIYGNNSGVISNNSLYNTGTNYILGGVDSGVIIQDNTFNRSQFIFVPNASQDPGQFVVFKNNSITNVSAVSSIQVSSSVNLSIINSVIYNSTGILFQGTSNNITINNNVFSSIQSLTARPINLASTSTSKVIIKNNIFYNITAFAVYNEVGTNINIDYNLIWENTTAFGSGVVDNHTLQADPLFVSGTDFHLQSAYGRWNGSSWVLDASTSPAIDAGDPTSDYSNEPTPNGNRINIGSYGNTIYASKSSSSFAPVLPVTISSYVQSTCASTLNWGIVGSSLLIVLIIVMAGGLAIGFLTGTLKMDTFPIQEFVFTLVGLVVVGSIGVAIISPIITAVGCP